MTSHLLLTFILVTYPWKAKLCTAQTCELDHLSTTSVWIYRCYICICIGKISKTAGAQGLSYVSRHTSRWMDSRYYLSLLVRIREKIGAVSAKTLRPSLEMDWIVHAGPRSHDVAAPPIKPPSWNVYKRRIIKPHNH